MKTSVYEEPCPAPRESAQEDFLSLCKVADLFQHIDAIR